MGPGTEKEGTRKPLLEKSEHTARGESRRVKTSGLKSKGRNSPGFKLAGETTSPG